MCAWLVNAFRLCINFYQFKSAYVFFWQIKKAKFQKILYYFWPYWNRSLFRICVSQNRHRHQKVKLFKLIYYRWLINFVGRSAKFRDMLALSCGQTEKKIWKNLLAFGSGPIDMVLLVCLCSVRIILSTTNIGQISRFMNDCVVVWFLVWVFVRFGFGMIVSRSHRTIAYRTCGWVQLYPSFGLLQNIHFRNWILCVCGCVFYDKAASQSWIEKH